MRFRLAAVLAVLLVAACSSHPPTAQLQSFSDAYKSANDAGQPLLDDLAVAERAEGRINAANQAGRPVGGVELPETPNSACPRDQSPWRAVGDTGFIRGYCVDDAPFFASLGDPPSTQTFRSGLAVVGKYVDVLIFLAEGRNIDELHAQLDSLSGSIAKLLAFVPSGAAAGPALSGALTGLKPLIDAAAQQQNDAEVRRLVLEGYPKVKQLIEALKAATPAMFKTLSAASERAATENPQAAQPHIARIEGYRVTVSNFVVLLNGLESALDKLLLAVQSPDETASLQSLSEETANLRIYAEAVRRAFAALNQGG
jgi:hypothetical protein